MRQLFRGPPQERPHVPVHRHGGEADHQGPAGPGGNAPHGERALLREPQDAPGLGEEHPPGGRHLDRPAAAVEQRHADFLLKQHDLPTQRRLREVQARGGPAEVKLLRDDNERPDALHAWQRHGGDVIDPGPARGSRRALSWLGTHASRA